MEKLAFALVTAARKLKPYFQAHTVNFLTDKSNPEAAGRLALWAIELSEFDIQYRPQTAIKGQILSPLIDSNNVQEIGSDSSWTAPLISNLKNGVLPDGKEAARKLKVQAARFVLIKDVLYKRGFSHPYLRCLGTEEADYVMREVHEGICGNHSGSRSLVHKLVRAGYYWPM
ncbi:uncharacterized protein LOC115965174 [Quercus lobata]|uniref:uncharacterized protein LOC115965174 n=1 Tax=Quercus lobata TaxID=97700 RepID=UPI001245FF60|nr:uncharacterized protein LOC115965174 [Quercus lobata]